MRFPKAYSGKNHETIGSDILAVLQVVKVPEAILGDALARQLNAVAADKWYPIQLLLDVMDWVVTQVGRPGLVGMGRSLFRSTHQKAFLSTADCAGDFFFSLDKLYNPANRGQRIGGWKMLEFRPGMAVAENGTPHHCELEEGIVLEAMAGLKLPVTVLQTACVQRGADACIFKTTFVVQDKRWTGKHPVL